MADRVTMETGPLRNARGRRRRVVLRASGKRRQLEVSEGSSDTCDSTSELDHTGPGLDSTTHYDHSALGWHSHTHYHGNRDDRALEDSVSSDVFREKLEMSGKVFHSTPTHPHVGVATIHHPMQPGSVSSTVYRGQITESPNSSDIDGENDDIFLERPRTAALQIHPESPRHLNADSFKPPQFPRPHTSLSKSSTDSTSPLHSKIHPKDRRNWGRKNRVHPGQITNNLVTSPAHSINLMSTSSSSRLSGSLNSTISSTLAPLLTTRLRKGGKRPSVDTRWESRGEEQLEAFFPNRHIRVLVATWNMQEEKELPESLDDLLLPLSHEVAADMYVIGTQESSPSRREWELLLQQTLGPHHVLVHSASLGVIYLIFFLRRDLIWFCSSVRSAGVATRPFTPIKTKGGVGVSFTLFGTSFLFITSHFTAHQQKVTERNSDMQKVAASLMESDSPAKTFDHVFWLGDLNYRVELDREEADGYLAHSDWMSLLLQDQLTKEILLGNVFTGYSEQPINFPPTYKFDPHSNIYDSSEKRRVPSWTDRILFKSRALMGITGCGYDSCQTLRCSDHRPVYAIFQVKLDPCNDIDGIPDSVGTFDREIYMKAHQQRQLVARLSYSLQGEDTPDGPSHPHPSRHTVSSSICIML